jgi:hypothetical protein
MNRTPFFDAAIKAGEPNLATDPEFDKLVKELRVNALLDENWALHFYTLRWFVIENKTEHEFMLSDCPILRINGLKGKDGGLGIFDNNVILVLPIGPKKILVMTQGPEIIQLKMDEIMVKVVAQLQYEVNRVSERFFVCRTEPIKLPYSG